MAINNEGDVAELLELLSLTRPHFEQVSVMPVPLSLADDIYYWTALEIIEDVAGINLEGPKRRCLFDLAEDVSRSTPYIGQWDPDTDYDLILMNFTPIYERVRILADAFDDKVLGQLSGSDRSLYDRRYGAIYSLRYCAARFLTGTRGPLTLPSSYYFLREQFDHAAERASQPHWVATAYRQLEAVFDSEDDALCKRVLAEARLELPPRQH